MSSNASSESVSVSTSLPRAEEEEDDAREEDGGTGASRKLLRGDARTSASTPLRGEPLVGVMASTTPPACALEDVGVSDRRRDRILLAELEDRRSMAGGALQRSVNAGFTSQQNKQRERRLPSIQYIETFVQLLLLARSRYCNSIARAGVLSEF
jgi:hypothetical protein